MSEAELWREIRRLDNIIEHLKVFEVPDGKFRSYNPSWLSLANPQPALGTGTLTGRYCVIGKFVKVLIFLTAGNTTTFGTGGWAFSLPLLAAGYSVGSIWMYDGTERAGGCRIYTSGLIVCFGVAGIVTAAYPFAWANTNLCFINIDYEKA